MNGGGNALRSATSEFPGGEGLPRGVMAGTHSNLTAYAHRLLPLLGRLLRDASALPPDTVRSLRRAAQAAARLVAGGEDAGAADVAALEDVAGLLERPAPALCLGELVPPRTDRGVLGLFAPAVEARSRSVGRVERRQGVGPRALGSGMLVGAALVLTTRGVALAAGRNQAGSWEPEGEAWVDFGCDLGGAPLRVQLLPGGRLHPRLDLALLPLEGPPPERQPLRLASQVPDDLVGCTVFAVGHPHEDGGRSLKRVEAGRVVGPTSAGSFRHDCWGVGADAGAAVVDLETGLAVGLQLPRRGEAVALWPLHDDPHLSALAAGTLTFL